MHTNGTLPLDARCGYSLIGNFLNKKIYDISAKIEFPKINRYGFLYKSR